MYKKLTRLNESLKTISNQNNQLIKNKTEIKQISNKKISNDYLPLHKDVMQEHLIDCIKTCSNCCNNLFNFSLLIPSAPWVSYLHREFRKALLHNELICSLMLKRK